MLQRTYGSVADPAAADDNVGIAIGCCGIEGRNATARIVIEHRRRGIHHRQPDDRVGEGDQPARHAGLDGDASGRCENPERPH